MSLNELLQVLKTIFIAIPFSLFDYILILAFIGYVIEEESYNLGIVIKRTTSLIVCGLIALVLYRFSSGLLQDSLFISKGIADGISLVGLWLFCIGGNGLISHFVVREKMNALSFSTKIKLPLVVLFSLGGFVSLAGIIIHVFISMPIPAQGKSFLTSSFFVQKMLLTTFRADISIQKLFTTSPSAVLHADMVLETDSEYDLRVIGLNQGVDESDVSIMIKLNEHRKSARSDVLVQEEILSEAALALAQKYTAEGAIANQSSELAGVLAEKGMIFSMARTVSVVTDNQIFLLPYLLANLQANKIILDPEIIRMGFASTHLGGGGSLAVFIFSD